MGLYFDSGPRIVVGALLASLLAIAVACGGGVSQAPGTQVIQISLEQGKLNPQTIRVTQGDQVTLKIKADEPSTVHFHGYNIETQIGPGGPAEVSFVAGVTGRFEISVHATASHEEKDLGILEVVAP